MISAVWPLFAENGIYLPPNVRAACGWPRLGGASTKHTIGQCWVTRLSGDNTSEIFISPILENPVEVAAVLVHELIHAADDCRHGHKGPFRRMALAVGLRGPMRSTTPGPELARRLNALCAQIGPYPHARLTDTGNANKQGTRLRKVVCGGCGYAIYTTRLWLNVGTPTCVCGSRMSEV